MNPYTNSTFFEFFYTFIVRLVNGFTNGLAHDEVQLFVLGCIATSCALIGTFLVWKQMAMLANALSHTILAGIVLAYIALQYFSKGLDHDQLVLSDTALIMAAIVTAVVTTLLTQAAVFLFGIAEDASTGIVFTFLFALGIILVTSFTRNSHIGSELLMGNADLVQEGDLFFNAAIMLVNLAIAAIFFRPLFVTSFDPVFANLLGYSIPFFSYLMMILTAVCAVGAFKAVGVLLFLAFLVAPPIIARLWVQRYKQALVLSCFIGLLASLVGVALSRHLLSFYGLSCSTGALIVVILLAATLISMWINHKKFSPAAHTR